MAHKGVPYHIAKEIDVRYVQPREEICVLLRWRRSLRQTCAGGQGRASQKIKNAILQNELT
jgi:hypothetical protein